MAAAIRIDGTRILTGDRHVDILFDWLAAEGMTQQQGDDAIEAGRVEFGAVIPHWQTGEPTWCADKTRDEVYLSTFQVIRIGGGPRKKLPDPA